MRVQVPPPVPFMKNNIEMTGMDLIHRTGCSSQTEMLDRMLASGKSLSQIKTDFAMWRDTNGNVEDFERIFAKPVDSFGSVV